MGYAAVLFEKQHLGDLSLSPALPVAGSVQKTLKPQ